MEQGSFSAGEGGGGVGRGSHGAELMMCDATFLAFEMKVLASLAKSGTGNQATQSTHLHLSLFLILSFLLPCRAVCFSFSVGLFSVYLSFSTSRFLPVVFYLSCHNSRILPFLYVILLPSRFLLYLHLSLTFRQAQEKDIHKWIDRRENGTLDRE